MERKKWSKKDDKYLIQYRPKKRGDYKKLALKLGRSIEGVRNRCKNLKLENVRITSQSKRTSVKLEDRIYELLLHSKKHSIEELSNTFNVCVSKIKIALSTLQNRHILIDVIDDRIVLGKTIAPPEAVEIPMEIYHNKWIKFGVISDTHLNSKYERLDILNYAYDIFQEEGIANVLHAGNTIDGYGRFNQFDVFNIGTEDQIKYLLEKYPQRKGITTHFITADDHEGWIVQREHINIGELIELKSHKFGRDDLKHLGYIEADVLVKVGSKPTRIRVFHPGGGTAYSLSYKPQKIVESLQGGDKPDILIVGHFHKLGYFTWRNVDVLLAGCTEDQTPFMRKKHIAAHLGFYIVKAHIAPDGSVNRIIPEKISFYDKGYYANKAWTKAPAEFEKPIQWFYKW